MVKFYCTPNCCLNLHGTLVWIKLIYRFSQDWRGQGSCGRKGPCRCQGTCCSQAQGPEGQEAGPQEDDRKEGRGSRRWEDRQVPSSSQEGSQGPEDPEEGRQGNSRNQGEEGPNIGPLPSSQDLQTGQKSQVPEEVNSQEEQVCNRHLELYTYRRRLVLYDSCRNQHFKTSVRFTLFKTLDAVSKESPTFYFIVFDGLKCCFYNLRDDWFRIQFLTNPCC